jgi:hypothetical protein
VSARAAGAWLVAAAALFWLSWALMPGVGITDAGRILALVGQHRAQVLVSVVLQLLSAACYAPAAVGLVAVPSLGSGAGVRASAALLLVGAMGSAADAVFHLLAVAMTAGDGGSPALVETMRWMQGPGLRLLLPLIASFFLGSAGLSAALARRGVVSRANPALYALAVVVGLAGGLLAPGAARAVGLLVLASVAGAQGWLGAALARPQPSAGISPSASARSLSSS